MTSVRARKDGEERGFTLIEIMIVVAIIGVLAAIAIPLYMSQANKARGTEAVLLLNKLAKSSKEYFLENHTFPPALAEVLPGEDGGACANSSKRFPPSSKWNTDPTWSALDFMVGDPSQFSYHFQTTGPTSAHAWAVSDPSCSGQRVTYHLYLEGRADGTVASAIIDPFSKHNPPIPTPGG